MAATMPATSTTEAESPMLRITLIGVCLAIVGILMMGVTMLTGSTNDADFHFADYVLTSSALPQGIGLLLVTFGVHRLQQGEDGRLGTVGVIVYAVCMAELVVECMASVAVGSELQWGPLYPLCAFGLMAGLVLLCAGSWRVGLLPRWMLAVWPPLGLVGSFLGVGPIPLVFAVFLVVLGVILPGRVRSWRP